MNKAIPMAQLRSALESWPKNEIGNSPLIAILLLLVNVTSCSGEDNIGSFHTHLVGVKESPVSPVCPDNCDKISSYDNAMRVSLAMPWVKSIKHLGNILQSSHQEIQAVRPAHDSQQLSD